MGNKGLKDLVTYLANLIEYSNLLYNKKFTFIITLVWCYHSKFNGVQDKLYGYFQDSNGLVMFILFLLYNISQFVIVSCITIV